MKDDKLRLRYPVFPNIIKFVVYGCICTLAAVFALYLSGLQPQTFRGKILCIVGFTALLVILVFTVMALLNAARNIILRATVTLDGNEIKITAQPPVLLKDIKSLSIVDIKPKVKSALILHLKSGEDVMIKQKLINIPIDTLKYGIEVRIEDLG